MLIYDKYSNYSDKQIIEELLKTPAEERFHHYFFNNKCAPILSFVSSNILRTYNSDEILGEVYEFLSDDNWRVVRNFNGERDSSLITYLANCIIRHFRYTQKREYERTRFEIDLDAPDTYAEIIRRAEEPEDSIVQKAAMRAFRLLREKDRVILQSLVIDQMTAMEAVDIIWPHICTDCDWRELPRKRVQDTIAMRKYRATLLLYLKFTEILNEMKNQRFFVQ